MMIKSSLFVSCFILILSVIRIGEAVRCFQCGSDEDGPNDDNCGAYKKFDKRNHIAIDCNSEESHMPGTFCMKVTQQSPKGFIWDGRWRQVIRRCASVADTGVTGVCNWGVYENGIYWEECYCSEDECNSASMTRLSKTFGLSLVLLATLGYFFQ
ncbi:UPAR/Ly6 domain-containing protein crok [Leptinotarsa decemlineata]|uniref:UPAR/Ly6 domain-containing protein crok n=1 Tax=Leptinotarsa decemlineata TaxID=7539 RepID=UPI003D30B7C1